MKHQHPTGILKLKLNMFLNEQLSNWAGTTYVRQQNRKMD